jgi:TolA-binding protein
MKNAHLMLALLPLLAVGCANMPVVQQVRADIAQVDRRVDSTRGDVRAVQAKLASVEDSLVRSGGSRDRLRADIVQALSQLSSDVQRLSSQVEGFDQRIADLNRQVEQMRSVRTKSGTVDTTKALALTAIESAYRTASDDFQRGRYDLAFRGYQDVLTRDSAGTYAPRALYQMGESRYAQGNWDEARTLFQRVTRDWPRSPQSCPALFKLGLAYEKLTQIADRDSAWTRLQSSCPGSNEAQRARDMLDAR